MLFGQESCGIEHAPLTIQSETWNWKADKNRSHPRTQDHPVQLDGPKSVPGKLGGFDYPVCNRKGADEPGQTPADQEGIRTVGNKIVVDIPGPDAQWSPGNSAPEIAGHLQGVRCIDPAPRTEGLTSSTKSPPPPCGTAN